MSIFYKSITSLHEIFFKFMLFFNFFFLDFMFHVSIPVIQVTGLLTFFLYNLYLILYIFTPLCLVNKLGDGVMLLNASYCQFNGKRRASLLLAPKSSVRDSIWKYPIGQDKRHVKR
jgi:hypothetical protein